MGRISILFGTMAKSFVVAVALLFASSLFAEEDKATKSWDISELLGNGSEVWKTPSEGFLSGKKKPCFVWLSNAKEGVRYADEMLNVPFADEVTSKLTFFDTSVLESILRFKNGTLNDIYVSIYNRADSNEWHSLSGRSRKFKFYELIKELNASITEWVGEDGYKQKKVKLSGNNLRSMGWVKNSCSILLKWSYSGRGTRKFSPEYVNVSIVPFDKDNDPRKSDFKVTKSREKLLSAQDAKDNIKRTPDGDVYVDNIPMVNQGGKGYCVVSTLERVLRYYGNNVDQHVLAQMAESSNAGTDTSEMYKTLKRCSSKLGVKVKIFKKFKWRDVVTSIKKYNKFAKHKGAPQVNPRMYRTWGGVFRSLDLNLYREFITTKDKYRLKKFMRNIRKSIDKGSPVVWTLIVGIIPEEGVNSIGGHMRLIIGYNDTTGDIIYSDSWGAGHEFKKMKQVDALIATTGYADVFTRKK